MAEETGLVKDPNKKKFWSIRNLAGLVLMAAVGSAGIGVKAIWDWFSDREAKLDALHREIALIKANQSSSDAIWNAISDIQDEQIDARVDYRAAMLLFHREFNRGFANADGSEEAVAKPESPDDPMPPIPFVVPPDLPEPTVVTPDRKMIEDILNNYVGTKLYAIDSDKERVTYLTTRYKITDEDAKKILRIFDDQGASKVREAYERRFPLPQMQMQQAIPQQFPNQFDFKKGDR